MREFFRGWRRKVGCVTLVMACVFMIDCFTKRARFEELMAHLEQVPADEIVDRSDDGHNIHLEYKNFVSLPNSTIRFRSIHFQRFTYFSHLSMIVPLTLLSAYLILSKPKKRMDALTTTGPAKSA